ncbi:Bifunctional chorismate mutase/prephenate dehydratase [Buchnera aphidicola (Protaphis terricola)]|uniref:chorismate mutase n=1 Tax=Buchnera aphidicola TaxID=9 RepID=UPI00346411FE
MQSKKNLLHFRSEINNIDNKIVTLLAQRKKLVLYIAESKIKNNQPIRDIDREKKLLSQLINLAKKKNLNSDYIKRIFYLIIEESILTQETFLKKNKNNKNIFSFLGPQGSYSHIATCKYAKYNLKKFTEKSCLNFQEVVKSVENNKSNYAILPIENNCSGPINEVFYTLKNINLFIVGEINIHINHCLLGIKKIELNTLKTIYSHQQPFKQCSNFINKFPHWKIKYINSTTEAMKTVIKKNKNNNAAIGSKIGSKIYGLKILHENISNKINNITRFICLSKTPSKILSNIKVKTTLLFILEKESKKIDDIILKFKQKQISIKILVFKNKTEKIFYFDVEEHISSNIIQKTFKKIQKITNFVKILGCYPVQNTKIS